MGKISLRQRLSAFVIKSQGCVEFVTSRYILRYEGIYGRRAAVRLNRSQLVLTTVNGGTTAPSGRTVPSKRWQLSRTTLFRPCQSTQKPASYRTHVMYLRPWPPATERMDSLDQANVPYSWQCCAAFNNDQSATYASSALGAGEVCVCGIFVGQVVFHKGDTIIAVT